MSKKKISYREAMVNSTTEYYEGFEKLDKENVSVFKDALERAWHNRDFEIELYWKRATYFWTFLVATFSGYFIIITNNDALGDYPEAPLLITYLGLTFSLAWVLVNHGSKKWQENWEKHVDLLEDKVIGPLHKTTLASNRPSVSKINLVVSYFVLGVWLCLAINSVSEFISSEQVKEVNYLKARILTLFEIISLAFLLLYSSKTGKNKSFNFKRRLLKE